MSKATGPQKATGTNRSPIDSVQIPAFDSTMSAQVAKHVDHLTKPQGSLGRLEEIAVQLAGITAVPFPTVTPPGVIVFAADHGIVEEGVSAYPQEVTTQMVRNILKGGAAINVFAKQIGASVEIVDVGIAADMSEEGLNRHKIRYGTGNIVYEEAMTYREAVHSIQVGMEMAHNIIDQGVKCLIVGEMGIGNTACSSAILAVLSEGDLTEIVGVGTGITAQQLIHKQRLIEQSIANRNPDQGDPLDILSKVGGLEVAAMMGAMIQAAKQRIPIVVDGFICTTAALLAVRMHPRVSDYMFIGHQSEEPGHALAIERLQKKPILDLGLRLGEGSGAALAFPIIEAAANMLGEMATFSSAQISTKELD